MDSQKSVWWPVALLAVVMVIAIAIGTLGLSYFVWGAGIFMVLLFIVVVIIEARSRQNSHATAV